MWVTPAPFISRVSQVAGRRSQVAGCRLSQPTANVETWCYSWEGRQQSILGSGRDKVRVRICWTVRGFEGPAAGQQRDPHAQAKLQNPEADPRQQGGQGQAGRNPTINNLVG